MPELIYIFDAKYRRRPASAEDESVRIALDYLQGIGSHQGRGAFLVQHSWLLVPDAGNEEPFLDHPRDFWTGRFPAGEAPASVGALPVTPKGDRLGALLDRMFGLDGVELFQVRREVG
ncbi:MAG TPA: hypothetical protein VD902_06650 [Symbiobacteriaceae bacterium]|nr:hypothetical protein [Symbiobacteriaceae bacterium]